MRLTLLALLLLAGAPLEAQSLRAPAGIAFDANGELLVAARGGHQVFRVDIRTGSLNVFAGTGVAGFSGDGGPAPEAALRNPEWIAVAPDGGVWIADRGNQAIRFVDPESGHITTVAGWPGRDFGGDGGPATAAGLTNPFGVEAGPDGTLYVFDTEAHSIRRISTQGLIHTVIGTGEAGVNADGPGTEVMLRRPHNGVFDAQGRLVFGDSFNNLIRRWDPRTGRVETLAGSGQQGSPADGQPAMEADLNFFGGLAVEPDGSLLFTSIVDNRIWRVGAGSGVLELVAGTGAEGFAGDGGSALVAQFSLPYGLALAPGNRLFVADSGNGRIRVIDLATRIITTVAGG